VAEGGLKVYTTIDPAMQRAADAAVEESIAEIEKTLPKKSVRPGTKAPLSAVAG